MCGRLRSGWLGGVVLAAVGFGGALGLHTDLVVGGRFGLADVEHWAEDEAGGLLSIELALLVGLGGGLGYPHAQRLLALFDGASGDLPFREGAHVGGGGVLG